VLGITRILGIFRRPVAFTSAALFALFAGAMTVSFGVKGAAQLFGFRRFRRCIPSGRLASVAKTQIK
jgi:hypothetical protein